MSDNDDETGTGEVAAEPYRPIDCGIYSGYEVAILHRETLRLHWRDEAGLDHIDRVLPLDLQTRDHAEYLLGQGSAGQPLAIRLDRILGHGEEQP